MGFDQTAVKTVGEEIGSGGEGTREQPDRPDVDVHDATTGSPEQFAHQPTAVLCGSYQRGVPSLIRAYEKLSAAGIRVLSPSGLDFMAEIDGVVLNQLEGGITPEAVEKLRLNCIRSADLVWLHAPDGYVGLSGALEIGFANAAGVRVYTGEMPSDVAVRSHVSISTLDQVIEQLSTGEGDNLGASLLSLREDDSTSARQRLHENKTAQEIILLISEEIGELARQNPGQRQRHPPSSESHTAS
jgi:hypothetical protein